MRNYEVRLPEESFTYNGRQQKEKKSGYSIWVCTLNDSLHVKVIMVKLLNPSILVISDCFMSIEHEEQ